MFEESRFSVDGIRNLEVIIMLELESEIIIFPAACRIAKENGVFCETLKAAST